MLINLLNTIYPIGSFYLSSEAASPSSFLGGSWEQIEGAVIRGIAEGDGAGYIGSDETTLTVEQMPAHKHKLQVGISQASAAAHRALMTTNNVWNASDWPQCNEEGGATAYQHSAFLQLLYLETSELRRANELD